MEFASPGYAWLTVPVLLILLLKLRGERIRREHLRALAEPHLLERLVQPEPAAASLLRLLWPTLAMLLLIVALMRPQWGILEEERSSKGLDVIFALDLSRSMLADDVAPSRLAMAKRTVAKVLESMPGDRAGIIGFAGTAFQICPLTTDRELVKELLEEAGTGTMPRGGSSLAAALREAKRAFRGAAGGGRVLVLLSDGEDHQGGIEEAAALLKKDGVVIVGAAVGTASGGLMPLPDGGYVMDRRGAVVKTAASPGTMRLADPDAVATSADASALRARLTSLRAQLRETERKERRHRLAERYYLPLSASLALSCLGLFFPARRGRG